MKAATLTQTDKAFFPTFGPFLVSAEVRQATASALTSEPEDRWSAVTSGRKTVAFAALRPHKAGTADFTAIYAVDGDVAAKRAAVEAAIVDARALGVKTLRVQAKLENADFYRELGFTSGTLRGGFIALTLELA